MHSRRVRLQALLALALLGSVAANCRNPTAPPPPPPVTEGPSITCPASVSVGAATLPAEVSYPAPVVAGGTAPVTTTCTHPSGTTFPSGTTDVLCTATDAISRRAQCVFQVRVTSTSRLKGTTFLAFGDSITEGEVSSPVPFLRVLQPENSYPTVLTGLLKERYVQQAETIVVHNRGIGGYKAVEDEDRLVEEIERLRPEVLLLLHGANDVNGQDAGYLAKLSQSLRADVSRAYRRGVRLVLLSTLLPQVPGRPKAFNPAGILEANDVIVAAAAREGAVLVDAFAAFNPQKEKLIGEDGLHPTVEGYQLLARTFFDAIRAQFEEPPAASAMPLLVRRPH